MTQIRHRHPRPFLSRLTAVSCGRAGQRPATAGHSCWSAATAREDDSDRISTARLVSRDPRSVRSPRRPLGTRKGQVCLWTLGGLFLAGTLAVVAATRGSTPTAPSQLQEIDEAIDRKDDSVDSETTEDAGSAESEDVVQAAHTPHSTLKAQKWWNIQRPSDANSNASNQTAPSATDVRHPPRHLPEKTHASLLQQWLTPEAEVSPEREIDGRLDQETSRHPSPNGEQPTADSTGENRKPTLATGELKDGEPAVSSSRRTAKQNRPQEFIAPEDTAESLPAASAVERTPSLETRPPQTPLRTTLADHSKPAGDKAGQDPPAVGSPSDDKTGAAGSPAATVLKKRPATTDTKETKTVDKESISESRNQAKIVEANSRLLPGDSGRELVTQAEPQSQRLPENNRSDVASTDVKTRLESVQSAPLRSNAVETEAVEAGGKSAAAGLPLNVLRRSATSPETTSEAVTDMILVPAKTVPRQNALRAAVAERAKKVATSETPEKPEAETETKTKKASDAPAAQAKPASKPKPKPAPEPTRAPKRKQTLAEERAGLAAFIHVEPRTTTRPIQRVTARTSFALRRYTPGPRRSTAVPSVPRPVIVDDQKQPLATHIRELDVDRVVRHATPIAVAAPPRVAPQSQPVESKLAGPPKTANVSSRRVHQSMPKPVRDGQSAVEVAPNAASSQTATPAMAQARQPKQTRHAETETNQEALPLPSVTLAELAKVVQKVTADFARQVDFVPAAAARDEQEPSQREPSPEPDVNALSRATEKSAAPISVLTASPREPELAPTPVRRNAANPYRLGNFVRRGDRLHRQALRRRGSHRSDNLAGELTMFLARHGRPVELTRQRRQAPPQSEGSVSPAALETSRSFGPRSHSSRRAASITHLNQDRHASLPQEQQRPLGELLQTTESPADYQLPETYDPAFKPIHSLQTNIAADGGEMPKDYATAEFAADGVVVQAMGFSRAEVESMVFWEPPAVSHRPLYFEEVNLERHGFSIGIFQPALSAAHFFGRVPAVPYLMHAERARECRYTLGHYRPGSGAPYELYLPPFSVRGSMAETIAVIGLMYALP